MASPRFITRVDDAAGATIYNAAERHTQAISSTTAYLMSSMLSDVISGGPVTPRAPRDSSCRPPARPAPPITMRMPGSSATRRTWSRESGSDSIAPRRSCAVDSPALWLLQRGAASCASRRRTTSRTGTKCPPDVEKVAICRASGARATDACKHQMEMYSVARADGQPQLVPADAMHDRDAAADSLKLASGESPVYEDLFAVGAVPPDLCPLHNASASVFSAPTSTVGAAISDSVAAASAVVSSPSRYTVPASDIVIERVLGGDGLMHVIMRQRR